MAIRRTPPDRRAPAAPRDIQAAAVALLARRDFAGGELTRKLATQGFDPESIAGVITDLTARHALDDARYAGNYVSYHAGRGQGPVRISADLRALGVAAELIEAALKTGPDWLALARVQRKRRFGAEIPKAWAEKARQARFLQYRGFSSDHIRAALGADFDADSQS